MSVEGAGLATGDWVAIAAGWIAARLPRRASLARRAAGRPDAEQTIAANIDVVALVQGLDRPSRDRRLHRAMALAWESGARPVIVFTKSDLVDDAPARALAAEASFGVDAHAVSVRTGDGLAAVAELATRAVRAGDAKGRHTTTARHLVPLPGGGSLIDTPGVRELGLWGSDEGVIATFGEIAGLAGGCRFRDCRHDAEPGCAVRAAVEDGRLDPGRLASFRDLARESQALALRADERA